MILEPDVVVANSQTLRQRVVQEIRRLIIAGQLRPRTRLIQQRLARQMNVSQSVVREALLEMQFTGLIESVDNLGMFVADVNRAKLLQAYHVREMMEGLAARVCCQTLSIADIRELTRMAEEIFEHGIAGRDRVRADLDRRFHDRLFELAQNEVLRRLSGAYHVVRLVVLKQTPHQQVREDHLRILEAIRANDADAAERAARQHVVKAREMIERQMGSNDLELSIAAQVYHGQMSQTASDGPTLAAY